MKKKIIVFFVLAILSFFGMIRSNEPITSGEELEMHVNIVNDLNEDLEDVHLSMLIYDLGIVINANTFDVDDMDNVGKFLFWETEGIPAGDYLVRITASNDDFRNVKHRYITII
jgi:uncharacterized membrane protein